MRIFVLIAFLFAFTAGSFADLAHAAVPDTACSHHEVEVSDLDQNCADNQTQDQEQYSECQDCCCTHTHIITNLPAGTPIANITSLKVLTFDELFYSNDNAPVHRPPIV